MPLAKRFVLPIKPETDKANKLGVTSILNAHYTADILVVSKLILIISYCAEGGRMQSLCHRFVVCFTIIIWSFGVAAAQHDVPPQNHNIKAVENAATVSYTHLTLPTIYSV